MAYIGKSLYQSGKGFKSGPVYSAYGKGQKLANGMNSLVAKSIASGKGTPAKRDDVRNVKRLMNKVSKDTKRK